MVRLGSCLKDGAALHEDYYSVLGLDINVSNARPLASMSTYIVVFPIVICQEQMECSCLLGARHPSAISADILRTLHPRHLTSRFARRTSG